MRFCFHSLFSFFFKLYSCVYRYSISLSIRPSIDKQTLKIFIPYSQIDLSTMVYEQYVCFKRKTYCIYWWISPSKPNILDVFWLLKFWFYLQAYTMQYLKYKSLEKETSGVSCLFIFVLL